ncbi:hypothetical protein LJC09_01745 [Desulfovibrio sp. OttesenSCG-928-F20]|nr:hypothetical protein [Desulfovibrio sp. OttesenSCG-928-F20]
MKTGYSMKRLTQILPLLLLLFFVCPIGDAWGRTLLFQNFSIDLPSGWRVVQEGNTVAFVALDKSATLQVTVENLSAMPKADMSAKELAEAYADEFKGSAPVMEDGDPNYYSFEFTSPDRRKAEASIIVSGSLFYLISIIGKNQDLAAMVESVLLSIL